MYKTTNRLFEVIAQKLGSAGVTELAKCLCLDLTNTLTGDVEFLTNLFKRAGATIFKTKAKLKYVLLSGGEGVQDFVYLLLKK